MRNRKLYIYVTVYLLLGTAAIVSVNGQPPSNQRDSSADTDTLDVVVPRGKPKAISDWALAGVVWSDACLLRKLATQSAAATEDDTAEARYSALAEEAEDLIASLEDFGWKRISRTANNSSNTGGSGQATDADGSTERDSRRQANDTRRVRPGERPREVGRSREVQRPREVGGATLVPSEEPIDLDADQTNFRLEGAGTVGPEILPPQVEKGLEEAIARKGLRNVEFAEEAGRISYRESQTRSGSMPYSYESIYDTDDYDPDVDYQSENPLAIADPSQEAGIERLSPDDTDDSDESVADMYGEDGEVEPAQLLDRLSGKTRVRNYTQQSSRHQQDADWVQMHLDMNQMLWSRLTGRPEVMRATQIAQLKLANSAAIAASATSNSRLRSILSEATE